MAPALGETSDTSRAVVAGQPLHGGIQDDEQDEEDETPHILALYGNQLDLIALAVHEDLAETTTFLNIPPTLTNVIAHDLEMGSLTEGVQWLPIAGDDIVLGLPE